MDKTVPKQPLGVSLFSLSWLRGCYCYFRGHTDGLSLLPITFVLVLVCVLAAFDCVIEAH